MCQAGGGSFTANSRRPSKFEMGRTLRVGGHLNHSRDPDTLHVHPGMLTSCFLNRVNFSRVVPFKTELLNKVWCS